MVSARRIWLRRAHRGSAMLIGIFITLHLANHLAAMGGQEQHITVMDGLRILYRNIVVETLILLAFLWQAGSGMAMVIAGRHDRRGIVAWAQAGSGIYLAIFLCIHVGALLTARTQGIDTNFNFAAAGIHAGASAFFVPYYFLSVAAIGTHVACAVYWSGHKRVAIVFAGAGAVAGALIIALLSGLIVPVTIPPPYLAAFVV
jgi:succinate dehydrogenase/fumarate reductase cytochrome b subunit